MMTTCPLGSVVSINPDSIGKNYPYPEIEYIDISSVGSGTLEGKTQFPISEAPSRAKRLVKEGDTILSTVRPNRRSFLYIKHPVPNLIVSTGFAVLRPSGKIDSRFLFYAVTEQKITDYLTANAKGAAYPAVDTETIARAQINLPSIETQHKIASILSAYDDLIENNTRRIKILEDMAQMIYREWFVKFRFPGHEKVKMVDSAMGRIPEGWEVAKVGELLEKTPRKKKIQKQDYIEQGEFPVVDQGKEFIGGYTSDIEAVIEKPLPLIVFGDHTRILKYIDFPFACGADGTQLLKTNTSRMPISLFYYALLAVDLSNFAYARHFKFLKEEQLIVPDQETASMFEKHVSKMHDHISCLTKKNHNLRQTRDLLLPKLISGEVHINNIRLEDCEYVMA